MTQAVVVRKLGDDFQGRMFWYHGALLLNEKSSVARVSFETGPRAFDDVQVEYDPSRAPQDHTGAPVLRDYLQCKWHVRPGEFGYADLIDPAFTNATSVSYMQRAREAQLAHAPNGKGARFKLVTNWRPAVKDALASIIMNQSHALDISRMFDGTTDASALGKLRKAWRGHLNIDDDELRLLSQTLGFTLRLESLQDFRSSLNERFRGVGMMEVPDSETTFIYDDLWPKLHAQGRLSFDRKSFRELCGDERLLDDRRGERPVTIGVRSFMHPIDNLDARCDETLNLVPHFDGRYIRDEKDWNGRLAPALREFLLKAARSHEHLRLALDAHVSLAFGVGAILNVKSGKTIEIEQRTGGRRFWSPADMPLDKDWATPTFKGEVTNRGHGDIALAISFTHDISDAVRAHAESDPNIGHMLFVGLEGGPSGRSIQCGRHAFMMAEQIAARIRSAVGDMRPRPKVHIFIAGPNGFAFFLGQNQAAIGPVAIYEWDFEGNRNGAYSVGLEFA